MSAGFKADSICRHIAARDSHRPGHRCTAAVRDSPPAASNQASNSQGSNVIHFCYRKFKQNHRQQLSSTPDPMVDSRDFVCSPSRGSEGRIVRARLVSSRNYVSSPSRATSGQPVTTSLAIALGTEVSHEAVIKLVRTHLAPLEQFGWSRLKRRQEHHWRCP